MGCFSRSLFASSPRVSVKFLHRPDVEEKAGATNTLAPALRVEGKKWPEEVEEVGIRARVA